MYTHDWYGGGGGGVGGEGGWAPLANSFDPIIFIFNEFVNGCASPSPPPPQIHP